VRNAAAFVGVVLTVALVAPAGAQAPAAMAPSSTVAGKKTDAPKADHQSTGDNASSTDSEANSLNAKERSTLRADGPTPPPPGPTGLTSQGKVTAPPGSASGPSTPTNIPAGSPPVIASKGASDDVKTQPICDIVTGCAEPSH
jgi:hypothetical protein